MDITSYYAFDYPSEHTFSIPEQPSLSQDLAYSDQDTNKADTLGIKCREFIKYCIVNIQNAKENEIQPPKYATAIGVKRRRLYDIIQVLEVIGIVSRRTNRTYNWEGVEQLNNTITKIKTHRDTYNIRRPFEYTVTFYGPHLGLELMENKEPYHIYSTVVKSVENHTSSTPTTTTTAATTQSVTSSTTTTTTATITATTSPSSNININCCTDDIKYDDSSNNINSNNNNNNEINPIIADNNYCLIQPNDIIIAINNSPLIGKSYGENLNVLTKYIAPISIEFQHPLIFNGNIWGDSSGTKLPLLTDLTRRLLSLFIYQPCTEIFYLKDIAILFLKMINGESSRTSSTSAISTTNNNTIISNISSSSSTTTTTRTTNIISDDSSINQTNTNKGGTKIKYIETRLYDVVNVLNSIGIIEKCNAKKQRGQSLGIRFTGCHNINLNNNNEIYCNESNHIRLKHNIAMSPINNNNNNVSSIISTIQQQQCNMPEKKRRKIDPWKCKHCLYINKFTFPACAKCTESCDNYDECKVNEEEI